MTTAFLSLIESIHCLLRKTWLALLLSLLCGPLLADHVPTTSNQQLKPFLERWIPEAEQSLSIAEVSAAANRYQFNPVDRLSLPVLNRDVWYRFTLQPAVRSGEVIINFSEVLFDEIDFHYRTDDGWVSHEAGLSRPYSRRDVDYRLTAFRVQTEAQPVDVYFRIKGLRNVIVNPYLQSTDGFFVTSIQQTVASMLVIGAIVTMLIYILISARYLLEPLPLLVFVGFLGSATLNVMFYDGYLQQLLGDWTALNLQLHTLITGTLNIFSLLFGRYFFELKKTLPRVNHLITASLAGYLLVMVASGLFGPQYTHGTFNLLGSLTLVILITACFHGLAKNMPSAGFYLVAILCYTGSVVYTILASNNILFEFNLTARSWAYLGTVLLAFFITLALHEKLKTFRDRELELKERALAADARNAAKSDFLATMSHEIRTPINGVLGMAQLLNETPLDKTQQSYIDILLNAGRSLQHVIDDILDFSKVEAGKLELVNAPFNLDKLLVYTLTTFAQANKARPIKIQFNFEGNTPHHLIGDGARLQQILNNLLSNAYKFTEKGLIELTVTPLNRDRDQVWLNFSITDTGIGIDREKQEQLFEPYIQADRSTTRRYGGTGLGLSICRQLVQLMGGEISVDSSPGKGSRFRFTACFAIDQNLDREFRLKLEEVRGMRVALVVMGPEYIVYTMQHFDNWGIDYTLISPQACQQTDFRAFDLIIASNAIGAVLEDCIQLARDNGCPLLVLDSFTDNYIEQGDPRYADIYHLSQPGGVDDLLHLVLAARQGHVGNRVTANSAGEDSDTLRAMRIMVAEDNLVNIKVIEGMLGRIHIQPVIVTDGAAAVASYREHAGAFDLVFMDCEMPEMDGFAATREIRAYEQQRGLPPTYICALTAHAMSDTGKLCYQAGMDNVLVKPLKLDKLYQLIRQRASLKENS